MVTVFIGLGGNMGNVSGTMDTALEVIAEMIGPIHMKSSRYKAEPWGNKNQEIFLNQVIALKTDLPARDLLNTILSIEKKLGRNRNKANQYGPRTIDIDILFYGKEIVQDGDLLIPHPRLHVRNFVMIPLMEIAPGLEHPVFKKNIEDLLNSNPDTSIVSKV